MFFVFPFLFGEKLPGVSSELGMGPFDINTDPPGHKFDIFVLVGSLYVTRDNNETHIYLKLVNFVPFKI